MFPRQRQHQSFRNASLADLVPIARDFGYEIVVIPGLEYEIRWHDVPGLTMIRTRSILDEITYFNYTDVLISPWSGMTQFALNCGCARVFYVARGMPERELRKVERNHFPFNPFNAERRVI